jgi:purine-binding chemotaxis protein CheW
MNQAAQAIDWQEAHVRLERLRQALNANAPLAPIEVQRILRQRAQKLAQPLEEAAPVTEVLELLVCSLAGEHYGIDAIHVLEVVPLQGLTPVPCTPPFVLGVVNHRGRILPVLDFRQLFMLAGQESTAGGWVVAVEANGMTFGIFAAAVPGVIRIIADEVAPLTVMRTSEHIPCVRGVTREMIVVLDLEGLTKWPKLLIDDRLD